MPLSNSHSRARWIPVVIVAVVGAALIGFCLWLFPYPTEPPEAYGQAADLNALLHRDPRFSEASAACAGGRSVFVLAPDSLSPQIKLQLEDFVRQHAKSPNTPVRYIPSEVSPKDAQFQP